MPRRIDRLKLTYSWTSEERIVLAYVPLSDDGAVSVLQSSVELRPDHDDTLGSVLARAGNLAQAFARVVQEAEELEVRGKRVRVPTKVTQFTIDVDGGSADLRVSFPGVGTQRKLTVADLPPGSSRLLHSLTSTLEARAWQHFLERLEIPTEGASQVFISYRFPHQRFAEGLAQRLAAEGLTPWFDKWEILAGDSIPGKIAEGLKGSMAFIPILTADYPSGRWATEELESAITKRVEGSFKVIPLLLEPCELPELIRHLRYVDFSAGDPETFESKVGEVIDAIYGLAVNPLRR